MLRYKVKLGEPKSYNEIDCDNLYLSPDLKFISGTTSYESNLVDGQEIAIEFDGTEKFHHAIARVEHVTRQGYVTFNQKYYVTEYYDYKGIRYIDGKYYFCKKEENSIDVFGKSYSIDNDIVIVPTIYYVEDYKLKIGDITYNVDINLYRKEYEDENGKKIYKYEVIEQPIVEINGGEKLVVMNCNQENWEKITKFYIGKNDDLVLKIDYASCAKRFPYFYYGNNKEMDYSDNSKIINYDNIKYYFVYDKTTDTYKATTIDNKTFTSKTFDNSSFTDATYGNESYPIEYEWRNVGFNNKLHLFVDNSDIIFRNGQNLSVTSTYSLKTRCDVINDEYIIYCGNRYSIVKDDTIDFMKINEKEYEITYLENIENADGYILLDNKQIPIKVNGNKASIVRTIRYSGVNEYDVIEYQYVTIDDNIFLVKEDYKNNEENENELIKFVDVAKKENFILSIDDVTNNNMLRCHVITNEEGEDHGICSIIAANYKNFEFKLINPLFEGKEVNEGNFILKEEKGDYGDIFSKIRLYNPSTYISIPLIVGNINGMNIRQEDILENIFTETEREKSINPYVDMEREIYYPCYNSETDPTETPILSLVNELQFYLHFRSRNLNDWKINEDVFTSLDESAKKEIKIKYNWNIFDNYKDYDIGTEDENKKPPIDSKILNDNEFKYYQSSDLLYFLNFNDDDVFYQKSRLAKSFLRLLFFDSKDVANQTLLYSCTVWVDEGKIYKKYIDNIIKKDNKYVSVSEEMNIEEPLTSTTIGVYNDTCIEKGGEYYVTFEEEKRLSATFTIKNRYESSESAEGFYLYIFKNYCEKLHEKTIYMKVEFNHAGVGRTINFTMPFEYDSENDTFDLLDLSPSSDKLDEFKKGYKLNELYDHLFIPINIVYDEKNNRYSYYLPNGLAKNNDKEKVMKFNLYELKIKDESDESNT